MMIGTDCICSCKSNYHAITTTMVPVTHVKIRYLSYLATTYERKRTIESDIGKRNICVVICVTDVLITVDQVMMVIVTFSQ
jgi:hypothetical protein